MLHYGSRETWKRLGKYFPGHKIAFRIVDDFCKACPRCQKDRLVMTGDIQSIERPLIPDQYRSVLV